jgi:hypothetical protein
MRTPVDAQLVVQRLRRQRGDAVVDLALQQQAHLHAALSSAAQGAAEAVARVEVGHGDVDTVACAPDGLDIAALDDAALAQVVAHQEGGAHRARVLDGLAAVGGRGAAQGTQPLGGGGQRALAARHALHLAGPVPGQVGAHPHRTRGGAGALRDRALQLDGKVQPRLLGAAVVEIVAVVDQVDAAHEGHQPVADTQLLVQPPQLAGLQPRPPAVERAEHLQLHAGAGKQGPHRRQRLDAAEAVDHHVYREPACGGVDEGLRHAARRLVVVEDVRGQPDLLARRGNGLVHAREQLVAALQQRDTVAAHETRLRHAGQFAQGIAQGLGHGLLPGFGRLQAGCSSAISGRWSDMRAQARPRGTIVEVQARPRR